jgi:hypothetical protein
LGLRENEQVRGPFLTFWRLSLNAHQPALPTELQKPRPREGKRSGTTGLGGLVPQRLRDALRARQPDQRSAHRGAHHRADRAALPARARGADPHAAAPPSPAPSRAVRAPFPIQRASCSWRPAPSCCQQREQGSRRSSQPNSNELLRPDVLVHVTAHNAQQ